MNKNSEDRGMMKWAPFYSVLSEKEINDNVNDNNIVSMPELSEDQEMEIETIIIDSYNNEKEITLTIFKNNKFEEVTGTITKLDPMHKAVYLNKKMILFSNIVKIKE